MRAVSYNIAEKGIVKKDKPKKKIDFAELGVKTEEAQMLAMLKQNCYRNHQVIRFI